MSGPLALKRPAKKTKSEAQAPTNAQNENESICGHRIKPVPSMFKVTTMSFCQAENATNSSEVGVQARKEGEATTRGQTNARVHAGVGGGKKKDVVCLVLLALGSGLLATLALGDQVAVDVGEDTTLGDCDAREELAELIVVADGELDVAGVDAVLVVVTGSVASELKDLGSEVLEDGGEVDRSAGTNALGVVALTQEAVDTTDGELQTGAGGAGLALARGGLARLATTRHDEGVVCVWLVVWWEKGGRERGFGLRSRESE